MTSYISDKKVAVIGAGGHARSVIALLQSRGIQIEGVFDSSFKAGSSELISGVALLGVAPPAGSIVVLAVGDNRKREELFLASKVYEEVIAHSSAVIMKGVVFGKGCLVFASAVVNAEANIGSNTILNSACVIEHECRVGDHSHISVGAILCGRVSIGKRCFIGAGAVVIDKISICDDVTIGAGSVVIRDIVEPGTYAGNPARKIK